MNVSLKIAWRYLFAHKRHNAINIVSGVSAAGVCVVTASLIIVLSVMNGFSVLVSDMFSAFDPPLRITASFGKTFSLNEPFIQEVEKMQEVEVFSPTIEGTALAQFAGKQLAVNVKGVGESFRDLACIDDIITDGKFSVAEQDVLPDGSLGRRFERCVLGAGLSEQLGASAWSMSGIRFFAPKRGERLNTLRPDKSLNEQGTFVAGVFAVNQDKYDASVVLVSLFLARQLFDYTDDEVSAIEIKLADNISVDKVKRKLREMAGDDFIVQDRYEQQADFFRVVEVEKLLTILLLTFILLIATFNIIGSLSMLMIDKREDMQILSNLGASKQQIRRIFLYEGWLISIIGAAIGLIIGITACYVQEKYGILKLGDGTNYIISAYPVSLQASDTLLVAVIVLLLGFLAAWYPTKQILKK